MPITRFRLLALTSLLIAACGINVVGTGADLDSGLANADGAAPDGNALPDGEGADSSTTDGSIANPAGIDADAGPDPCAATCPATTAADAGPVLLGDGTVACPSGFDSADWIESPTPHTDACTCGDCQFNANCNTGSVDSIDGMSSTSCTNDRNNNIPLLDGGCHANYQNSYGDNYVTYNTPNPVNVSCTSTATANQTAYDATKRRVCSPQAATCAGSLCGLDAGAFALCVSPGSGGGCPSDFPTKHELGVASGVSLTCPDCQCTNPTVTCGGTMMYYSSNDCSTGGKAVVAGACTSVNQANFGSQKWTGSINPGGTCTTTAQPATASLATGAVICCPK